MYNITSSDVVGPELLKLFGIDCDNVKRFTIICNVNSCVEINVEYIGEFNHDTENFETVIKEFIVTEKEQ